MVLLYNRNLVLLQCQKKGKTIYGLFVCGDCNTPLVEDWKKPYLSIEQINGIKLSL